MGDGEILCFDRLTIDLGKRGPRRTKPVRTIEKSKERMKNV